MEGPQQRHAEAERDSRSELRGRASATQRKEEKNRYGGEGGEQLKGMAKNGRVERRGKMEG